MNRVASKILTGAREALAIARCEAMPARVYYGTIPGLYPSVSDLFFWQPRRPREGGMTSRSDREGGPPPAPVMPELEDGVRV